MTDPHTDPHTDAHDPLAGLAALRVTGAQTPSHLVLARGRTIRRRRRAGGGAALAAVAVGAGALAVTTTGPAPGRGTSTTPASGPTASAAPAPAVPTQPADACTQAIESGAVTTPTPAGDVPQLVHLVGPAPTGPERAAARTAQNPCGSPDRRSGAVLDAAGVVRRSWTLTGPMPEGRVLDLVGPGTVTALRRTAGRVAPIGDVDIAVGWEEESAHWALVSHGMTRGETLAAVEQLRIDDGTVDPGSLPPADVTGTVPASAAVSHVWQVHWPDAAGGPAPAGWGLTVSDGPFGPSLPPVSVAVPGDRFADVAGVRVLVSANPLARAVWQDRAGRVFVLSGGPGPAEALALVPQVRRVAPGDPRVTAAVAAEERAAVEAAATPSTAETSPSVTP